MDCVGLRDGEGPSDECSERSGVLHALLTDCGLPGAELLTLEPDANADADSDGVRLRATLGKWTASTTEVGSPALELMLLPGRGLALKPASVGSGIRRGDTWTL